jgi:hypothetical protein
MKNIHSWTSGTCCRCNVGLLEEPKLVKDVSEVHPHVCGIDVLCDSYIEVQVVEEGVFEVMEEMGCAGIERIGECDVTESEVSQCRSCVTLSDQACWTSQRWQVCTRISWTTLNN